MRGFLILLAVGTIAVAAITEAAPSAKDEGARLHKLFEEEWEWSLRDDPEDATYVGDRRYDDRLTDRSAAAYEARRAHNREVLRRIRAIDRSKLNPSDRLSYDVFLVQAEQRVEGDRFPREYLQIDQMRGVHDVVVDLAQAIPRDSVADYENFLKRMRAYPRVIDDVIALLRKGVETGITPPRIILRNVAETIGNQIVDDPTKSPIYQLAFTEFRETIPPAERQRLQRQAADAIGTAVMPALRRLHEFYTEEYYPKTRESIAWTTVPDGADWYAWRVRTMTTTRLTPDEIHALGVSEVARIRAQMENIAKSTNFEGTLTQFFEFLRTDPRFFFTEREALLTAYRDIAKRIDPELTRLFGILPRLPYGVIAVPEYSEKVQTTAYYNGGSPESHRPGYFYANLYDLKARPKWEMEALTLHEAVPGHHLQIALAQELTDVPKFRRQGGFTAFVEGWGLYAESLGPELGMYKDPYSKFGQLTYEMWRAVRLVVDTGMHSKGWTRQQAIDFFRSNSSKPLHDIEVEIDRYLAWPGQALAYKIGELKIKELRASAEKELGERFDIRAFHDHLLGSGPLPMSLLETRMKEWVKERKRVK